VAPGGDSDWRRRAQIERAALHTSKPNLAISHSLPDLHLGLLCAVILFILCYCFTGKIVGGIE
jgi:hypothetical protein